MSLKISKIEIFICYNDRKILNVNSLVGNEDTMRNSKLRKTFDSTWVVFILLTAIFACVYNT